MKRKPPVIPFSQTVTFLFMWAALLFLLFFLTACSADGGTQMYLLDAGEAEEENALTYLVDPEQVSDSAAAEDGTLLASCSYQLPLMTVLRRDGTAVTDADAVGDAEQTALRTANAFNGEFRRWAAEADFASLANAARQDFSAKRASGENWSGSYSQTLTCDVYQTDRLVSAAGLFYYFGGGAHPNRVYRGWNFDLRSGSFLSPDQLFSDTASVTAELLRQAENRAEDAGMTPEEFFWPDYKELLADWDAAAVTFDGRYMTVSWSPYDLAAYAAGEQVFSVSLDWLAPYLNSYGRDLLGVR